VFSHQLPLKVSSVKSSEDSSVTVSNSGVPREQIIIYNIKVANNKG